VPYPVDRQLKATDGTQSLILKLLKAEWAACVDAEKSRTSLLSVTAGLVLKDVIARVTIPASIQLKQEIAEKLLIWQDADAISNLMAVASRFIEEPAFADVPDFTSVFEASANAESDDAALANILECSKAAWQLLCNTSPWTIGNVQNACSMLAVFGGSKKLVFLPDGADITSVDRMFREAIGFVLKLDEANGGFEGAIRSSDGVADRQNMVTLIVQYLDQYLACKAFAGKPPDVANVGASEFEQLVGRCAQAKRAHSLHILDKVDKYVDCQLGEINKQIKKLGQIAGSATGGKKWYDDKPVDVKILDHFENTLDKIDEKQIDDAQTKTIGLVASLEMVVAQVGKALPSAKLSIADPLQSDVVKDARHLIIITATTMLEAVFAH
jgi:hypothetical protein